MENRQRPPIASPDGNVGPLPSASIVRGEWSSAPKIVRFWAYPLTWLGIISHPFMIYLSLVLLKPDSSTPVIPRSGKMHYLLAFVVSICLNYGLKKGAPWAWGGEIALSCFALFNSPLRKNLFDVSIPSRFRWQSIAAMTLVTLIQGYFLFHWLKPETRAWFKQI